MMMLMHMTMQNEAGLDRRELEQKLLKLAAGEHCALEALYDRTRASVYALCLSMLKNTHDAQDATQDTFVRIWESAPQYRPQGSPMAWILTVARNICRMKLRQEGRQETMDEEAWQAIPAPESEVSAEDKEVLQTALGTLATEERQIVLLHAVTGLKHREIASLLELPLPTVLSKYHRALKKMRQTMKGDDPCD